MHIIYKLIALSVVFGLVLTGPVKESVDNDKFDTIAGGAEDVSEDESRTVDVVLPAFQLIPALLSLLPKIAGIVGIKAKALGVAVAVLKWLVPKTLFLAIGAIASFAFCKLSNLCTLAYDPVMYDLVPPQVRSFVTPERLEDAQQFLVGALQQYANEVSMRS